MVVVFDVAAAATQRGISYAYRKRLVPVDYAVDLSWREAIANHAFKDGLRRHISDGLKRRNNAVFGCLEHNAVSRLNECALRYRHFERERGCEREAQCGQGWLCLEPQAARTIKRTEIVQVIALCVLQQIRFASEVDKC